MEILIGVLVGVLLLGVLLFVMSQKHASSAPKQPAIAGDYPEGFVPTAGYVDTYGGNGIAVDGAHRLCVTDSVNKTQSLCLPRDLLMVEVWENEVPIAKTMRQSEQGKILITRLQEGETGSLLNYQAEESSTDGNKHIILRIIMNNLKYPCHVVTFLNMEAKEDGFIYKQATRQVTYWQELLSRVIKQADQEDRALPSQYSPAASAVPSK